ncbi:hypothetical protein J7E49_26635 [Variovorax paradoxus]|nr:hypothetical protein [Variovorax paradoxus]
MTIDKHRLGDLWLPSFHDELAALVVVEFECTKQARKRPIAKDLARWARRHRALLTARCAVENELHRTVEVIRERGGLLLCVVHA